jgi:hypothetical protein
MSELNMSTFHDVTLLTPGRIITLNAHCFPKNEEDNINLWSEFLEVVSITEDTLCVRDRFGATCHLRTEFLMMAPSISGSRIIMDYPS